MDWIYLILKIIGSIFFAGFILGGIIRASPAHRNPEISPAIEYFVGAIGFIGGILGLYWLWF